MLLRDAQGRRRLRDRHQHARDRAHQPHGLPPHRLPRAAEQGDRRAATRSRTSPASTRTACSRSARPTRSWTRPRSGWSQLARARQALRPARAAAGAAGARLHGRRPGAQHGVQALQGDRGQEEAGHRDGPGGAGHRRAPRRAARLHAASGSTSRHRAGARRTRPFDRSPPDGDSVRGDFTGDGPVDAIFRAINAATRREARLREFRIDSVTGGQDALGEASVVLELAGQSAGGQGVSTDIIEAAALAYVRALSNAERKVAARGGGARDAALELTGRRSQARGPDAPGPRSISAELEREGGRRLLPVGAVGAQRELVGAGGPGLLAVLRAPADRVRARDGGRANRLEPLAERGS